MNQDNDDIFNNTDPEVNHFAEIFPVLNNSEHRDYYSIDKFNENCMRYKCKWFEHNSL